MLSKSVACVFALALLAVPPAFAQDQSQQTSPPPPAAAPAPAPPPAAPPASTPAMPAAPATSVPESAPPVSRIRIGGNVMAAKMIHQVQPIYPQIAKTAHLEGTVVLHAIITKEGYIRELQYVSGPPLLMKSSMDAVRQWRYEPTLLQGQPVEVDTMISIVYKLGDHVPPAPPLAPEVDPQLKADILYLMEVARTKETITTVGHQMFNSLRPAIVAELPSTPNREQIADAFESRFVNLLNSQDFLDRIVVVYSKYLSDDDIKALIQFYQSSTGQHFITAMPQISSEMFTTGTEFGEGAISGIWVQICEQYPELNGKVNECSKREPEKESLRPEDGPAPASLNLRPLGSDQSVSLR
ncbi:MAG: energy transducer TonB [Candidatus Acidiferrales bacterium]